jgi:hypothetical protein
MVHITPYSQAFYIRVIGKYQCIRSMKCSDTYYNEIDGTGNEHT